MKKSFAFLSAFVMLFCLSACTPEPEDETREPVISFDAEISTSEAEDENPEPDIPFISLITDESLPESFIEPIEGLTSPRSVFKEEVSMTDECREIYEKYISNADITLSCEFSENEIPFSFLTHVFYVCERLDHEVLGIEESGYDMAESYWVPEEIVEKSLCRWFPWSAEDIRDHFEYNSETGEYSLPGAGGGPYYSYVTDFEYIEDDLLRVYISEYDGYAEKEPFPVTNNFVLDIRLNDDGSWTYLSNKKIDNSIDPIWFSGTFSCGAAFGEWNYGGTSTYYVFTENETSLITVYGSVAHKMFFDEKPCSFFISSNGLWVYGYDSLGLRHISELPSEYDCVHSVKDVWLDTENRIIISYMDEIGRAEIAVLDYETFELINYFNTGIKTNSNVDIPMGLKPETIADGKIEIYDTENGTWQTIDYIK